MKKCALISILLMLAGCVPHAVWTKPEGFTQQEFNQDNYACEKDMRQSGYYGSGIAGGMEMNEFFNKCMTAHGWVLQRQADCSDAVSVASRIKYLPDYFHFYRSCTRDYPGHTPAADVLLAQASMSA